jgi:four helix bundle protein
MAAPYRNLIAWQRADALFLEVHRVTLQHFPAFERFELGRQIRRSAYSVPANIVEGNARQRPTESAQFFNIAASSLSETGYGLHAAHRLRYLDDITYKRLERMVREVGAPLHGLLDHVRQGKPLTSQM